MGNRAFCPVLCGQKRGFTRAARAGFLAISIILMVTGAQAAPVTDPNSGHTYELIDEAKTWADAEAAARAMTTRLTSCHLATITSQAENDFVLTLLPASAPDDADEQDVWIGGEQRTNLTCNDDPEGNDPAFWGKWVTGEAWDYTNWATNAPDDCDNCLMYSREEEPRKWDEEECDAELSYLVECEPVVGAPTLSPWGLTILSLLLGLSSWWTLGQGRPRLRSRRPA